MWSRSCVVTISEIRNSTEILKVYWIRIDLFDPLTVYRKKYIRLRSSTFLGSSKNFLNIVIVMAIEF